MKKEINAVTFIQSYRYFVLNTLFRKGLLSSLLLTFLITACHTKKETTTTVAGITETLTVIKIFPETDNATSIKIIFKKSERM
jgi:hypothetical protein